MTTHMKVLSASTLMGDTVRNTRDEELGNLEEIMLDLDKGQIAYAVLSCGGFLGFGDKYFAVPWQALIVDTEKKEIVLDISKEKLEKAPGFDKDNWPHTLNRNWLVDVYSYYGYSPYWN
jgi:sporulation protein YlmC with PRC-barrel domain